MADLKKEARGRGVPDEEVSIALVKELMCNQEAHMVGAMASALQTYAQVPDKKRKEAVATKGKSASPSPGPRKKVKNARAPAPQRKVPLAPSSGRGRPSTSKAEVPRFEDIAEEAAAAATRGSDAHGHVESGLIELEEVIISVELDEAGEPLLPPGFEPEDGCNPHEEGPYLPVPAMVIKGGSLNRVRPGLGSLLPDATAEAMCAKIFADPNGHRLLPGVGAHDLSALTWATRRRIDLVEMCTVQRAMALSVPMDVGIDGGCKMKAYSRELLEADLRIQLFETSEMETAPVLEPRAKFGGCSDLLGAPATSGGGGMMSGSVKALDPGLGMICGIEASELKGQLAGGALPFDELVTQVATQMLATSDCKK
jgi:hypothetical protein